MWWSRAALVAVICSLSAGCRFDENGISAGLADRIVSPRDGATDATHPRDAAADAAADADASTPPRDTTRDFDADGPPAGDTTRDGVVDTTRDTTPPADTTRDTAPPPDTTRDTAPPPDTTRDTAPPPDTTRDSAPPVYINESFDSGPGVLSARSGSWTYVSGSARQSTTSINGALLHGKVPVADYVVETRLRIHGIRGQQGIAEGAGVAARIQPSTKTPPPMYLCIVSPDYNALFLAYSNGGTASSLGAVSRTVALNTPYVVRLRVQGNQITCSSPTLGASITRTYTAISSAGSAGVVTMLVDASFEYLTVTGL